MVYGKINQQILSNFSKTIELPTVSQQSIKAIINEANSKVSLKFGNAQHIGSRKEQQDSFGYSDITDAEEIAKKGVLAVLADGMGGLAHGKLISEYVVSSMLTMFANLNYEDGIPNQLENMAVMINEEVSAKFSEAGKSSAGSTLAASLVYKSKLFWVCVGDSRIYIYRRGALYQLNEDHDYLNHLLTESVRTNITLDEAKNDPQKNALTSYIGNADIPYIDFNKRGFAMQRDDKILLCSDGVYDALNNADIIACLKVEPQVAAEKIARAVLDKKANGQDNLSVMVIEYK